MTSSFGMMKGLVLSFVLAIAACEGSKIAPSIRKCCPKNQIIGFNDNYEPMCVDSTTKFPELEINFENGSRTFSKVNVEDITSFELPSTCHNESANLGLSLGFKSNYNPDTTHVELIDLQTNEKFDSDLTFCFDNAKIPGNEDILPAAIFCSPSISSSFCHKKSNTCIQFCSPKEDEKWKPKALIKAEKERRGLAIHDVQEPTCLNGTFPIHSNDTDLTIQDDGQLSWGYIGKKWKPQEYCVEKGDWDFETYYVCYGELPNVGWMNIVELGLIPSLDIISAVFLVLTFGLLYREQRQRLFGCVMLSTLVMLFVFYIFEALSRWITLGIESPSCIIVGFVIQYAHMSALFWLSAIGYNVWNSFRNEDIQGSKTNKLGIYDKKYKWYALYSWGCPFVMTVVTLIMQNVSVAKDIVTPKIGFRTCSLEPEAAMFFYFHLINIPIMIVTLGFLSAFVWNIFKGPFSNNLSFNQKKKIKFVAKLSIVMGPTWIMDVIGWAISFHSNMETFNARKSIFIFDLINSLQGLFIFLAFFFTEQRIKMIKKCFTGQSKSSGIVQRNEPNEPSMKSTGVTEMTSINMEMKEIGK